LLQYDEFLLKDVAKLFCIVRLFTGVLVNNKTSFDYYK